ncbi:MAG: phosphodiester glycosidase family protein [Candidatus Omnitrophica bacterium]|nr:phosphodiester glycosidase family protein [Candidatus Omnitrophota bacterium]
MNRFVRSLTARFLSALLAATLLPVPPAFSLRIGQEGAGLEELRDVLPGPLNRREFLTSGAAAIVSMVFQGSASAKEFRSTSAAPYAAFVRGRRGGIVYSGIVANMNHPRLEWLPVTAAGAGLGDVATVPEIARAYQARQNRLPTESRAQLVAAFNGSFFDEETGIPIGAGMSAGKINFLNPTTHRRSALVMSATSAGHPQAIRVVSAGGKPKVWIELQGIAEDILVDAVNVLRGQDGIVVYTRARGKTTGTNKYGVEIVVARKTLRQGDGPAALRGEILKIRRNQGNAEIPEDGFVLSMHNGAAGKYLDLFKEGLPLELKVEAPSEWQVPSLHSMVTAGPSWHVSDGQVSVTAEQEGLGALRSPDRMAAGITGDNKMHVYWLHQQRGSHLSFGQAAKWMAAMGMKSGIFLDGGGSASVFFVDSEGRPHVVRAERAVADALLLIEHEGRAVDSSSSAELLSRGPVGYAAAAVLGCGTFRAILRARNARNARRGKTDSSAGLEENAQWLVDRGQQLRRLLIEIWEDPKNSFQRLGPVPEISVRSEMIGAGDSRKPRFHLTFEPVGDELWRHFLHEDLRGDMDTKRTTGILLNRLAGALVKGLGEMGMAEEQQIVVDARQAQGDSFREQQTARLSRITREAVEAFTSRREFIVLEVYSGPEERKVARLLADMGRAKEGHFLFEVRRGERPYIRRIRIAGFTKWKDSPAARTPRPEPSTVPAPPPVSPPADAAEDRARQFVDDLRKYGYETGDAGDENRLVIPLAEAIRELLGRNVPMDRVNWLLKNVKSFLRTDHSHSLDQLFSGLRTLAVERGCNERQINQSLRQRAADITSGLEEREYLLGSTVGLEEAEEPDQIPHRLEVGEHFFGRLAALIYSPAGPGFDGALQALINSSPLQGSPREDFSRHVRALVGENEKIRMKNAGWLWFVVQVLRRQHRDGKIDADQTISDEVLALAEQKWRQRFPGKEMEMEYEPEDGYGEGDLLQLIARAREFFGLPATGLEEGRLFARKRSLPAALLVAFGLSWPAPAVPSSPPGGSVPSIERYLSGAPPAVDPQFWDNFSLDVLAGNA